jgi:nicotinamide-nucleotide amidase
MSKRIEILAETLGQNLLHHGWQVLAAESCSGGQIAAAITRCAGSSEWFSHSLVTYSNAAKMKYLNISEEILNNDGAVSERCAQAMIQGLNLNSTQLGVAVTGYAGPSGGDAHYPPGTVFLAWASPVDAGCERLNLRGNRQEVVNHLVFLALRRLVLNGLYPEVFPRLNYFFALSCDDELIRNYCLDEGLRAGLEINQIEPNSNLHLTLSYLGKLQESEKLSCLERAQQVAKRHLAFDLIIGDISYWSKPDAYVLECESHPKLMALAHDLGAQQSFKPHISLSKHNRLQLSPQPKKSVHPSWMIRRFALFASWHGAFYLECASWSLS